MQEKPRTGFAVGRGSAFWSQRRVMVSRRLLATVIIAAGLIPLLALAAETPRDTTVCELYKERASPRPERVRVKATAWLAPRHGAILVDPTCGRDAVIGFRFVDHLPSVSKAASFSRALTGNTADLSLRGFDVEVEGLFTGATDANPKGLFYIDRVNRFESHKERP